jgi:hypothetical protein
MVFRPRLVNYLGDKLSVIHLSPSQAKSVLAMITALAGGGAAKLLGPGAGRHPSLARRIAFSLTAPAFVVLALVLLAWGDYAAVARLESVPWLHWYEHPIGAGVPETVFLFVVLVVTGLAMGFFVNVNKFSLHGMCRNRLIRISLGASRTSAERTPNPFTGFDPNDNIKMWKLKDVPQPAHVINTTLNLVATNRLCVAGPQGRVVHDPPLHCGSHRVAHRPSSDMATRSCSARRWRCRARRSRRIRARSRLRRWRSC